jgi:large subunit ribosomal protein L18
MKKQKKLYVQQKKRYLKKIVGTTERPRLAVFRSHKHIYGQLIDDKNACTLVFCSTLQKDILSDQKKSATQEASFLVGKKIGEKAKEKSIEKVVFDKGQKTYAGRIKSLADGAREAGLCF